MNIQHSSRTDLWYTPLYILDRVRKVLGRIDLDPASDYFGNSRVKAGKFYAKENNGLERPWFGSVYCNPPGGKVDNKSLSAMFWQKLMRTREENTDRSFSHAIWMCFSTESAAITQRKGCPSILAFPICVPASRIRFDDPMGVPGKGPSHSNIIVYVPGSMDETRTFIKVFSELGDCKP